MNKKSIENTEKVTECQIFASKKIYNTKHNIMQYKLKEAL